MGPWGRRETSLGYGGNGDRYTSLYKVWEKGGCEGWDGMGFARSVSRRWSRENQRSDEREVMNR